MSRTAGPTLINLPPLPSESFGTPSDFGPGTPNSGFSTTAIKDGHQGTAHPHTRPSHHHTLSSDSTSSTNTLDAERADRISRLAGLERVATLRGASQHMYPGQQSQQQGQGFQQQQQLGAGGYFDPLSGGVHKSTVGSASATGSAGGRGTWASGSVSDSGDRMSEDQDQDDGISSVGLSDGGDTSLVGFGEGAGSTVSGPTSAGGPTSGPTSGRMRRFGVIGVGEDASGVGPGPVVGKQGREKEKGDGGSPMEMD